MKEDLVKSRLTQVFSFAKALNELRNPVVSRLENQRWHLLIDELPVHKCIFVNKRDVNIEEAPEVSYVIKVRRPTTTDAPEPPVDIIPWIKGNWRELEGKVKIQDEITIEIVNNEVIEESVLKLEEEEEIKQIYESWIEKRNVWIEREISTRKALKVFEDLYWLYSLLERESETVELMLGDGILFWDFQSGFSIRHPVLLQKVIIAFDVDIPEFRVKYTEDPAFLYTALFRGISEVQSSMLSKSLLDLEQENYDPMEEVNTSSFLKRFVMALSAEGSFTESEEPEGLTYTPTIIRKPVLFLRKRNLSFAQAIDSIIDDIGKNENIPDFIKAIAGVSEEVFNQAESTTENETDVKEISNYNPNGQDRDILFTKPANAEQLAAAKHFQRSGAVLVQGPPGTGKTHTIANMVGHLLSQGKNILITSHTEKALNVLRDKIAEPLQPLCLPLLSKEGGREEMEKTLEALNEKRSSIELFKLIKDIVALREKREVLLKELEEKRNELKLERMNEYRNIVLAGKEYTPIAAAKYITQNRSEESWIPSPIELGASIPLSKDELYFLYGSNKSFTKDDEEQALNTPLILDKIITSDEFEAVVEEYNKLENSNYTYKSELWIDNEIITIDNLNYMIRELEEVILGIQCILQV